MAKFTFSLRPDDARAFRDLARLLGTSEEALASDVLKAFVTAKSQDEDVQAGLRAVEKLRRDVGTTPPAPPARPTKRIKRAPQGRSLTNFPDGIEVHFEGKTATVRDGHLEFDGQRFASPSPAAVHAAGGGNYNGWLVWKDRRGATLAELHRGFTGG